MMKSFFYPADILLPKKDFERWAVVACDQFTSQPEYWNEADRLAGDAPSALRLVLPEAFLGGDDAGRIEQVNNNMHSYLENGVFDEYPHSMIYVERETSAGIRRGLVGAIALEDYDYRKGSRSQVRATEQTVLERIPPRVKIRSGAELELPHVMLLVDDVENRLIGRLEKQKNSMKKVYGFELMLSGGRIDGWLVPEAMQAEIEDYLNVLEKKNDGFLFAVGDGNHSLAAAKECAALSSAPAAQYALAEVVNIHDPSLVFEPIYRVVSGVSDTAEFAARVRRKLESGAKDETQEIRLLYAGHSEVIRANPTGRLAVGTLQAILDRLLEEDSALSVDYIHGEEVVHRLCERPGCVGFLFDSMRKSELFCAVMRDGCLPRKTFSMGQARDKRYYVEARRIK